MAPTQKRLTNVLLEAIAETGKTYEEYRNYLAERCDAAGVPADQKEALLSGDLLRLLRVLEVEATQGGAERPDAIYMLIVGKYPPR